MAELLLVLFVRHARRLELLLHVPERLSVSDYLRTYETHALQEAARSLGVCASSAAPSERLARALTER